MILAVLQARMSSRRFPGKVLADLLGAPMLERQLERLRNCKLIDRLVVATSDSDSDDPIEEYCLKNKIDCYRGSLDDVLDRYHGASTKFPADHVVRLTADCPLIDAALVDQVIDAHLKASTDYTSNTINYSYPDGLDVEIMKSAVLDRAWCEANLMSEREHVTLYIKNNPDKFRLQAIDSDIDLSALRWTVDERQDLKFVSHIYSALYPINPNFGMNEVLEYIKSNPDIQKINHDFIRNEGLLRSLEKDHVLKSRGMNES